MRVIVHLQLRGDFYPTAAVTHNYGFEKRYYDKAKCLCNRNQFIACAPSYARDVKLWTLCVEISALVKKPLVGKAIPSPTLRRHSSINQFSRQALSLDPLPHLKFLK